MSNLPDPIITISWKNTFNCNNLPPSPSYHHDNPTFRLIIKNVGYPYYCLHGKVFDSITHTKIGISEIELDYYLNIS